MRHGFPSACLCTINLIPDPGMRNVVLCNRKSQYVRCSVCAHSIHWNYGFIVCRREKTELNTANETQSKYGRAESNKSHVLRQRRPTTDNDILLLQSLDRQTFAIKIRIDSVLWPSHVLRELTRVPAKCKPNWMKMVSDSDANKKWKK